MGTKRNGTGAECDFDDFYPPRYIKITVDANSNMTTRFILHELIHVILSEIICGKFDPTVEEAFILGLENFMWAYISGSPQRLAKWEKLIAKKLAESAPVEDVPLLELAERPAEK